MAIQFSAGPGGFSPALMIYSGPAASGLTGIIPLPYPDETFIGVWYSIIKTLKDSDVFNPKCVFYAINPRDSKILWPATPPPYALIVPGKAVNRGDSEGGGRHSKVYHLGFQIWVVTRNILDDAWHDTDTVITKIPLYGNYPHVDQIVNVMEQAYLEDDSGRLSVVELPTCLLVGDITRFKDANEYVYIPIQFEAAFCQRLPGDIP